MRLAQVSELRKLCLALAAAEAGRAIIEAHPDNETVKRTAEALGRSEPDNQG